MKNLCFLQNLLETKAMSKKKRILGIENYNYYFIIYYCKNVPISSRTNRV